MLAAREKETIARPSQMPSSWKISTTRMMRSAPTAKSSEFFMALFSPSASSIFSIECAAMMSAKKTARIKMTSRYVQNADE